MEDSRQPSSTGALRGAVAAGIIAVAAFGAFAATPAHAQGRIAARVTSSHFLQTATSGNTSGDATEINSSATNGKPHAILFVTEDTTSGSDDNHPYGVYYTGVDWAIFNEDRAAMPVGAQFFVLAFSGSSATDFTLTAAAGNTSGDSAFINSSKTNNKPSIKLQVTQNWNPGGGGGTYNDHNVGVWDEGPAWGVFNEDIATMPAGPSFNILVGAAGTADGSLALEKAAPSNINGNACYITNSHSDSHPSAIVFVTQDWNPGNHGGTYDNTPLSVSYSSVFAKWQVQNRNGSPMANHTAFNVLIFSS